MLEKRMRDRYSFMKWNYEVNFADGIPARTERKNKDDVFIYPEELIDKKCGGCVRCEIRDHGEKKGWHCSMRHWDVDISPDHKACVDYWDRAENERSEREHAEAEERRREELWAIYAEREPVKLPIVNDGYGRIPTCPICGEMPYDTKQCYWCGQRFIQDMEITEYSKPKTVSITCPTCGTVGKAQVAKYNGHKHFHCEKCGCTIIE